jgi:hypothetical protein
MNKKGLLFFAITVFAVLFAAAALHAGTKAPDVIKMQDDYEHTKGIVEFSHAKHHTDYKAGCGECHHDANNKPLTNLKDGDDVKKCIECHKKPGEVPKDIKKEWREKKIKRAEQKKLELEYHAEALHENCRECHKEYNKKNKTKAAPTTCTKCHPKVKK